MVSPHAPSPSPSPLSSVLVPTRLFMFQSQPTPARTGIYEREVFEVINHQAVSKTTTSVATSYSVRLVQSRSLSEAGDVEILMREIHSA